MIANPRLASAIDPETNGAVKLAMGPVSAPLKMGGLPSAPWKHHRNVHAIRGAVPKAAPSFEAPTRGVRRSGEVIK